MTAREAIAGDSRFFCPPYGTRLTPYQCVENQTSLFCLPGWPCEDCAGAVGIQMAAPAPRRRRKLPAWLHNASAAVVRDWLREHGEFFGT